ncbi:MAG: C40 family peptidase [Deltaproteobacteria bacterium]|jgi:LysM repeat protein|nr:C40 family peptidase [Deltaproteobacteria bacterium]
MNASAPESHQRTNLRPAFRLSITPLIFLLAFAFGCAQKSNYAYRPKTLATPYSANSYSANLKKVNNILKNAFSQVGVPYRYGGISPETGFDCSGFVNWVYKQNGVVLPRSSREMMTVGVPIAKEDLRPGDLVFFNYGYSHVGIYTGDDKYIHSPRTGKTITESDINGRGRKERFVAARRVIDNQGVTTISEGLKAQWVSQSRYQAQLALNEKTTQKRGTLASARGLSKSQGAYSVVTKKIKVVSGDTLVTLAKRHGVTTAELVAANRLANKHKLKLGQVLLVPIKAQTRLATANDNRVTKTKKVARSAASQPAKNLTAKATSSLKAKSSKAKANASKAKVTGSKAKAKKTSATVKQGKSAKKAKAAKSQAKAKTKASAKANNSSKAQSNATAKNLKSQSTLKR